MSASLDWWLEPAIQDLRVAPEVSPAVLPSPLLSSLKVSTAPTTGPHLVATRKFAPGDSILVELAAATADASKLQPLLKRGGGDLLSPVARWDRAALIDFILLLTPSVAFSGEGRAALVRMAAQLLPSRLGQGGEAAVGGAAGEGEGEGGVEEAGLTAEYANKLLPGESRAHVLLRCMRLRGIFGSYFRPAAVNNATTRAQEPLSPASDPTDSPQSTAQTTSKEDQDTSSKHATPTHDAEGKDGGTHHVPTGEGLKAVTKTTTCESMALFPRGALFSHSCAPNTLASVVWDRSAQCASLHAIATRNIEEGEALTIALVDPMPDAVTRSINLALMRGLQCRCTRCAAAFSGSGQGISSTPSLPVDDTIHIKCPECGTGSFGLNLAMPGHPSVSLVASSECNNCGIGAPSAEELLSLRCAALSHFEGTQHLPMLRAVLQDYDTAAFARLLMCLPEMAKAGQKSEAVALSWDLIVAARKMPFFNRVELLRLLADHAILCGVMERPDDSAAAWRDAAALGRELLHGTAPHMVEMYESFAAKPPRNLRESAAADRIRRIAAALH